MDLFVERILNGEGNFLYYDIAFELGKLKTVDGIDEIANRIIVNLNTYVGENYRDVTHGVDYFNNVFGHETSDVVTQDELKRVIINTRGVIELTSFGLTRPAGSRVGQLTANIQTSTGEVNITTPITL